jgi:hypothetical protein
MYKQFLTSYSSPSIEVNEMGICKFFCLDNYAETISSWMNLETYSRKPYLIVHRAIPLLFYIFTENSSRIH